MIESVSTNCDFIISKDDNFIKLEALNADAVEWIKIAILKPSGLDLGPAVFKHVRLPHDQLEETLRSIMAEGYKVNFKQA